MESSSMASLATKICNQISSTFTTPSHPHPPPLDLLTSEITTTKDNKIFLYGVGREGLMLRAMCMRLTHLGLDSHFVMDPTAPPISAADLLVASTGPGGFATVEAICTAARRVGARVVVLTAQPGGTCARLATAVGYIPAKTMAEEEVVEGEEERPVMLMGSVYEGALFVLCEMVVYKLGEVLGQSVEVIRSRHTNLE